MQWYYANLEKGEPRQVYLYNPDQQQGKTSATCGKKEEHIQEKNESMKVLYIDIHAI